MLFLNWPMCFTNYSINSHARVLHTVKIAEASSKLVLEGAREAFEGLIQLVDFLS